MPGTRGIGCRKNNNKNNGVIMKSILIMIVELWLHFMFGVKECISNEQGGPNTMAMTTDYYQLSTLI